MGANPLEVYHPVHEVRAIRRATHIVQTDLQGEHAIASRAREDRVRCPWRDHRDAPPINRDGINADVVTEAGGGTRRRRGCIAGDDVGNVPRSFFLALEIEAQATDRQARKMNRALQQSDDVEGAVDLLGRDHRNAGGVEERHIFNHDVRGTDGAQHPDAQSPPSTEHAIGTRHRRTEQPLATALRVNGEDVGGAYAPNGPKEHRGRPPQSSLTRRRSGRCVDRGVRGRGHQNACPSPK